MKARTGLLEDLNPPPTGLGEAEAAGAVFVCKCHLPLESAGCGQCCLESSMLRGSSGVHCHGSASNHLFSQYCCLLFAKLPEIPESQMGTGRIPAPRCTWRSWCAAKLLYFAGLGWKPQEQRRSLRTSSLFLRSGPQRWPMQGRQEQNLEAEIVDPQGVTCFNGRRRGSNQNKIHNNTTS